LNYYHRIFQEIPFPILAMSLPALPPARNLFLRMTGQKTREIAADKAGLNRNLKISRKYRIISRRFFDKIEEF